VADRSSPEHRWRRCRDPPGGLTLQEEDGEEGALWDEGEEEEEEKAPWNFEEEEEEEEEEEAQWNVEEETLWD